MAHVNCSRCGKQTEIELRSIIQVAEDPELKLRVKDGSLFVWECPYCGSRNLAKYPVLYHDPQARLMIWLFPGDEMPPKAVEEAVAGLEGYTFRLVREVGDLIEKVNIQDAALDDVVMEVCKWVTRQELAAQNPETQEAPLRFLRTEGADNDLVLALPLNGQMQLMHVGFNVYEDARGIVARNPDLRPAPGFAQVDAAWLEQFFR